MLDGFGVRRELSSPSWAAGWAQPEHLSGYPDPEVSGHLPELLVGEFDAPQHRRATCAERGLRLHFLRTLSHVQYEVAWKRTESDLPFLVVLSVRIVHANHGLRWIDGLRIEKALEREFELSCAAILSVRFSTCSTTPASTFHSSRFPNALRPEK